MMYKSAKTFHPLIVRYMYFNLNEIITVSWVVSGEWIWYPNDYSCVSGTPLISSPGLKFNACKEKKKTFLIYMITW